MNKLIKVFLIYMLVALPIMLLTEYGLNGKSITWRQGMMVAAGQVLNFIVVTAVIRWINKQQQAKTTVKKEQ